MFGFLYFCALISRALVELCLEIAAFPFYATAALNEWLYRGCYWAFRMLLRLLYLPRVSALAALLGELGLFLVLWRLIGALLRRYCGLLIS